MASLFWLKSRKVYIVRWRGLDGKPHQRAATADKRIAGRIALKIESDLALRREGVIDPYLEAIALAEGADVVDHLRAFAAGLEGHGAGAEHVRRTTRFVALALEACGIRRAADLDAGKLQGHFADLARSGLGARARNARLGAVKQFGRWLYRTGRTRTERTAALGRANVAADRRRERRALADEEIERLLATTEISPAIEGMTGPDRALLYRLALGTGLRASEIRTLTIGAFDLDGSPPTVTVEAAYSKHRRRDVQPMRRDLAERLRPHLARYGPDDRPFPVPTRVAEALARDLEAAGIERVDRSGRVVDFHALRHTFISGLARAGVTPAVAKALARHGSISLTMDHYTHTVIGDLGRALEQAAPQRTQKGKRHA